MVLVNKMEPDPSISTHFAFYFSARSGRWGAMSTAQLEVTPWSKAGKGHLAFQPTGAHWDRAGSAEALGEQLGAISKRAAPLDQAAARLLTLHFGEEEETAAEEPAVASGVVAPTVMIM